MPTKGRTIRLTASGGLNRWLKNMKSIITTVVAALIGTMLHARTIEEECFTLDIPGDMRVLPIKTGGIELYANGD